MTQQQYPEPTVGALILNQQNRALFVQSNKWRDMYAIPGGHIELGETMEEALRREVEEETGLAIHSIEFASLQEFVFDEAFHEQRHFIFIDFVCRTDAGEDTVELNEEGQGYTWVSLDEALGLPLEPYTRRLIQNLERTGTAPNRLIAGKP
jgi:nucleoside triphosphatase